MIDDLLSKLNSAGITLAVVGDELDIEGPEKVLTDNLLDQLKAYKSELIKILLAKKRHDPSLKHEDAQTDRDSRLAKKRHDPSLDDAPNPSSSNIQGGLTPRKDFFMAQKIFAGANMRVLTP